MTTLRVFVLVLLSLASASQSFATVITFEGGVSGSPVAGYDALGVIFPSWRFHDITTPGTNQYPFIDNWGIVPGDFPNNRILFPAPIHALTLDGFLQADEFGALRQWTLTAYNNSDLLLGSVSGTIIGVGSPVPGTFHTFLPSAISLTFQGNQVSRAEVSFGGPFDSAGAKFGVDTLLFTPDTDLAPIPEPSTLLLWGTTTAGLGVARWLRRRSRVHAAWRPPPE